MLYLSELEKRSSLFSGLKKFSEIHNWCEKRKDKTRQEKKRKDKNAKNVTKNL